MEDDKKKKKKNKKKKNKQAEATDNFPVASNGQVSQETTAGGRSDDVPLVSNFEVPEAVVDDRSVAIQGADVNRNEHEANGTQCTILAESEKLQWLQREVTLEETINQLRKEKDLHIQKEATLKDTVIQLQNENDSHRQKEATLEDALNQLQHENELQMQKEAGLQMEIVRLMSEKDSWLEKEVGLEEKISRLVGEKGHLDLKVASLHEKIEHLEKDRDAWIRKEDSRKENIATMNDNIARLQAQVLELEQSRNNLVQENKQLMENSSNLQLQIKILENVSSTSSDGLEKHTSEREDLNSQVEEAYALVERLVSENAELVEKVNELYVELDRLSATVIPPETATVIELTSKSNEDISTPYQNPEVVPVTQEMLGNRYLDMSTSDQKLDSREVAPIKQEMHSNSDVNSQLVSIVPDLPVSDSISEIVQIPLDENEDRNLELSVEKEKNDGVALTDAPLIGAPFRLMSFVARYISGADLVNNVPTNASH